ncbi:hypothetical protein KFE25_000962 [Diacronema lutheri]|uniref:Uncharacterized protein n=2 Tax=Diacronema lutheri TaxID=2081491 RepID=A0A8J6C5Y3_DIALT|nr:hypothetical protein KFE25_000962 [Diacronema lutheri]
MSDDSTVISSVLSNIFLFMLITGMAGTTDLTGFRAKLRNYRGIGTGLACQFILLPFLGFSSVKAFGIPRLYGIMLLIVTSSPGGGFSGWWCNVCNADLALSVAMTTVSTIFSVALLPLNILIYVQALYGVSVPLNWGGIMTSVAVVIGGVIAGLALGTKLPMYKRWLNRLGTVGGIANIAVGIATAGGGGASSEAFNLEWWWYVGCAAPCIVGLGVAFAIARALRCSYPESVAICIECCYQNTALAIAVAVSVFPPKEAALATLVPLYYGIIEIVLIAIFALAAWQLNWTYAPRTDNVLKCVAGNYQPDSVVVPQEQASAPAPAPAAPSAAHMRARDEESTASLAFAKVTLAAAPPGRVPEAS